MVPDLFCGSSLSDQKSCPPKISRETRADGLSRGEKSDIPLYGSCSGMAGAVVSQTAVSFCSLGKTWGVNLRNQGSTGPLFRLQPQGKKSALPGLPCAQRRLFRCLAGEQQKALAGSGTQSSVCHVGASKPNGKVNGKPQQRKGSRALEDPDPQECSSLPEENSDLLWFSRGWKSRRGSGRKKSDDQFSPATNDKQGVKRQPCTCSLLCVLFVYMNHFPARSSYPFAFCKSLGVMCSIVCR